MSSTNDVTGDYLVNKKTTDAYRDNYDKIFGKKNKLTDGQQKILDTLMTLPTNKEYNARVTLTKEQQAAVDDTAGISQETKGD